MNCTECKEKLVELLEGLLPETQRQIVEEHLKDCQQCQGEFQELKELSERITSDSKSRRQTNLEDAVFNRIIRKQNEKLKQADRVNRQLRIWRLIMNSKITRYTAAAVIIIAVVLTVSIFNKTIPTASAAEVLQDAIDAVSDIWSVHMKTRMRTLPKENFSLIGLNYDFVPIEMWKRTDEQGLMQWRVEKPGRVLLMDGQNTTMLIRPNRGVLNERPVPLGSYDSWSGRLLNVQDLLDNELQKAKDNPDSEVCLWHKEIEGQDKIILEVEVAANVPEGDYLRNSYITGSDHLKVYQFDAKTKLLEGLGVYVHDEDKDVLIFEITEIEYNIEIDDGVFALDLPENMNWYGEPKKVSDNEKYETMTPKEAAETFFQACADENWDEALKFWPGSQIDDRIKESLGGLTIISIGEPFQSEGYARNGLGWFVPYEISFRPVERNVQLSNANSAGRFVITGWYDDKMQLQEEMKWASDPEILADNDIYVEMSPDEVVKAYYDAFSRLDWDEMRKFMPADDVDKMQQQCDEAAKYKIDIKKQLPTVEIKNTFWSQEHSSYFVTYREFRVKKFNLAIRKDNPANRFVVDGGL
jgi:outer membrane lipoprotein-sorting protein